MRNWPADWGGPSPALRPGGCAWAFLQAAAVGRRSKMRCWTSSPTKHWPGAWAVQSKRSKPGGNGWEYRHLRRNDTICRRPLTRPSATLPMNPGNWVFDVGCWMLDVLLLRLSGSKREHRHSGSFPPSDGERDGVRGAWSIPPLVFGNWNEVPKTPVLWLPEPPGATKGRRWACFGGGCRNGR